MGWFQTDGNGAITGGRFEHQAFGAAVEQIPDDDPRAAQWFADQAAQETIRAAHDAAQAAMLAQYTPAELQLAALGLLPADKTAEIKAFAQAQYSAITTVEASIKKTASAGLLARIQSWFWGS